MGYKRVPRIYTLEFDGDMQGMIVRIKSIKFGKARQLVKVMESDDNDESVMEAIADELVRNIVSWNLLDEEGQELPVTREGVDELEFEEVFAIVNKWLETLTGPGPELGKDSSSGETFPGQPLTMEAL